MSTSRLILSRNDEGLELTHDEFADAKFEGPWRYERVHGRLVVMSPSGFEHHIAVKPFRNSLGAYELQHPEIVEHVLHEAWIVIDDQIDRIADIGVYLRSDGPLSPFPDRIPEIVFEIVSESAADRRRDYEEKRAEYERVGVREYVIVDRFEHRLTVLRRDGDRFFEHRLSSNAVYTTPLLPGLEIPLTGIV